LENLRKAESRLQTLLFKEALLISELLVLKQVIADMPDTLKREQKEVRRKKVDYQLASVQFRLKKDTLARLLLLEAQVQEGETLEKVLQAQIEMVLAHQLQLQQAASAEGMVDQYMDQCADQEEVIDKKGHKDVRKAIFDTLPVPRDKILADDPVEKKMPLKTRTAAFTILIQ
jgi:hypothetical protein